MIVETITNNIKKAPDGIYYSKAGSNISYPEEGNADCMQIEEDSYWFKHRNNVIAKSVLKHSPGKVFYDIGGGNGYVSKKLQDKGIKVVLLEPGKTGVRNAAHRGIKNIICSTLEDASFIPECFDSVGLFDVVEHIKEDTAFLKEINSYMKTNGHIYITVPAYNFLWSKEDDEAGHFKRYTIKKLNRLLVNCGFNTIYSTYIFSILPIPIYLFRTLPSKMRLLRSSNNTSKDEHTISNPVINSVFQYFWNWELSRIQKDKKIPFGGSCFVIAKKV